MTNLRQALETHVAGGAVPGAVALVASGGQPEVEAAAAPDARAVGRPLSNAR